MTRKERIAKHFQKKNLLTVSHTVYKKQVLALFDWMVSSDTVGNDLATKTLDITRECVAEVIVKQTGIISGIEEIVFVLQTKTNIVVTKHVDDGYMAHKGDVILGLSGSAAELLGLERTVLNFIGRMSGIATYTHEFVSILQSIDNPPLLVSTRKTPWMALDKKAVCVGGGGTHRVSLSDFALVKDTHLFAQTSSKPFDDSLREAVQKMMKTGNFFEIEVANGKQAYLVLSILEKATYKEAAIMLDNPIPKAAEEFMQRFKTHPFYEHVYIEASGEVTKENLLDWAKTGVDIISSGSLTHSAPTCDVSLRMF